jgi:hypothetical protein
MDVFFRINGMHFNARPPVIQLNFELLADGTTQSLGLFQCEELQRNLMRAPNMVLIKLNITNAQLKVSADYPENYQFPNFFEHVIKSMTQDDSAIRAAIKSAVDDEPSNWPKLIITKIEPMAPSNSPLVHCDLEC